MSISRPTPLTCPFCGAKVPRPQPMKEESYEGSEGGFCICGAAYALDSTSHNLGRAMLDAYAFAAGSADLALDLDPEKDLDEAVVKGYDLQKHRVMPVKGGRYPGSGGVYFARLRPEAAERLAEMKREGEG